MAVVPLNMSNFQQTVDRYPLVVIKFHASWCGPCKMYAPMFERIAARNATVFFGSVDIDAQKQIASYFKVRSVPTTIFVRDATVVDTISGVLSEKDIEDKVRRLAQG